MIKTGSSSGTKVLAIACAYFGEADTSFQHCVFCAFSLLIVFTRFQKVRETAPFVALLQIDVLPLLVCGGLAIVVSLFPLLYHGFRARLQRRDCPISFTDAFTGI